MNKENSNYVLLKNRTYIHRIAGNLLKANEDYSKIKDYHIEQVNFNNFYCNENKDVEINTYKLTDSKYNLTIENFEDSFKDIHQAFSSVEFYRRTIGIKSKATFFQAIIDRKLEIMYKILYGEDPLKVLEEYCDIFIQTVSENFIVNTSLATIIQKSKAVFPIIVYDILKQNLFKTVFLIPKIESREIDLENPYKFLSRLFVRESEENDAKSFINECLEHMDHYFQVASKRDTEDL